jgi:predicted small metal-binding protein
MALEFECGDPECTFEITSVDADEIVEHVRLHAQDMHDKGVDEGRVRERIREV